MTAAYLEKLNPEQRLAVEHGTYIDGSHVSGPLLVIAGAGSGKTNTLAHRVAHLIVKGADPRRILLMTFSRRAASEMGRRGVANEGQAHRIELVQRGELAVSLPPVLGHGGETGDLFGVDG